MGRVEDFLGNRLRGRSLPEDLRGLVEMHLDGQLRERSGVKPFGEFELLRPGVRHPLEEPVEPLPTDPEPEQTRANCRAIDAVLEHVAPVVRDFDGNLWGYWLHPDEPADVTPWVVLFTTEGEFHLMGGNLIESMAFHQDEERDMSELAAYCARFRIPFAARSFDDLRRVKPMKHPVDLHEELFERMLASGG